MKIRTLLISLFLVGCHSVDLSRMDLGHHQINSCAKIYVLDERPYIVSKDKSPDFVGIVRGGYGNPFDFSTSSGKPMASELGRAIEKALDSSSGSVQFVDSRIAVQNSSHGCKTIVLSLKEWKIDAMVDAWFNVDASMSVYSKSGGLLAKKDIIKKYAVDGSFVNPLGAARKNFLKESKKTINLFLSDDKISAGLS